MKRIEKQNLSLEPNLPHFTVELSQLGFSTDVKVPCDITES